MVATGFLCRHVVLEGFSGLGLEWIKDNEWIKRLLIHVGVVFFQSIRATERTTPQ